METNTSMAITVESVRSALGASALRQRLIADNIANVNSPDHVRMKAVFEEYLASALQGAQDAEAVSIEPQVVPAGPKGAKVQLDQEMVDLSSNALKYQALSRGLSKYLSIASLIASQGRG